MSTLQKIAAAVLGVLLLVVGWGLWATNQLGATPVRALKATARPPASGTDDMPVIDESTFLTARRPARARSPSTTVKRRGEGDRGAPVERPKGAGERHGEPQAPEGPARCGPG